MIKGGRKGETGRKTGEEWSGLCFACCGVSWADVPSSLEQRITGLPVEEMEALSDALLDMTTPADMERWLARHQP